MTKQNALCIRKGTPSILGACRIGDGYHFAVEVPKESDVSLLFYYKGSEEPTEEIVLGKEYQDGGIRSVMLSGFKARDYTYNYRIDNRIVQDPFAYVLYGTEAFGVVPETKNEHRVRCGFLHSSFEWGEDKKPAIPYEDMILYKLHVRGYTKQYPMSLKKRGTFAGLTEMIPYWKDLGINAIELMPAYEFEEILPDTLPEGLVTTRKKQNTLNFWGYTNGLYMSPKRAYCATKDPEKEFCTLVKALHEAGMECIMEFYFPLGMNLIQAVNIMQFWRLHYHIDGIHMTGQGAPVNLAMKDPVLEGMKLFSDGFDTWQVPDGRSRDLAEYNEGFLREMRRFLMGDENMIETVIQRIKKNPEKQASINFLVYQNGFTLADMVSYQYKHNEENGENNKDGQDDNFTWNCGIEGPTRKGSVRQMRERQMRNAILLMLLCQGTPMLYAGDEIGNSQSGNNNAYCQDNPTGWVDWKVLKKMGDFHGFVKKAVAFRLQHPILHMPKEFSGSDSRASGIPDVSFHGERAWFVNREKSSRLLGVLYNGAYAQKESGEADDILYVAYNFHQEKRTIALPNLCGSQKWHKVVDTSMTDEKAWFSESMEAYEKTMEMEPRSIVILKGKQDENRQK